jgi:phthiocerol/phenolphthiocerol synthesis type-I polyketide synthase C
MRASRSTPLWRLSGADVEGLSVGDRVAIPEPDCFANRLNAPADVLVKLPEGLSLETAAGTQSAYNTAHHALLNLAGVKKGDTVLIHSAAGGVGHAAVSICQYVGAVVYATTSSAKRGVVEALGVDADKIFDSRSTSWFAGVHRATHNVGVNVVLNSLAGKHQDLGVAILRPGGTFLEIGKADVYANAKIGLMALRKNLKLCAIDMDRMAVDDPELTLEVRHTVFARLAQGDYRPVPYTTFPMQDIKEALTLMRAGKHIGKVGRGAGPAVVLYRKVGDG